MAKKSCEPKMERTKKNCVHLGMENLDGTSKTCRDSMNQGNMWIQRWDLDAIIQEKYGGAETAERRLIHVETNYKAWQTL